MANFLMNVHGRMYLGGIMDFLQAAQNFGALVGAFGVVELIKFFVSRKDKKQERQEDRADDIGNLRVELKKHLEDTNADWKTTYCDKNAQAIAQVARELSELGTKLTDNVLLLTNTVSDIKEYNSNIGDAINGIIHDRIIHNVDGFIERGGITQDELATLTSMYEPYRKLGGNGNVQTAYEIAVKLPIITKEQAIKRDNEIRWAAYEKK